jgi:hypothetical protein
VAAGSLALLSCAALVAAAGVAIAGARATATSPTDPARLPIGDGKVSLSGPKRGWVYACQPGNPNAGGAFKDGPWIRGDGSFDLTAKAAVDGTVTWSSARFAAKRGAKKVMLGGNGLPVRTPTGTFPVSAADDAYQYDRNPNSIRTQPVSVSLPASPRTAARPSCLPFGAIGYATNGVAVFNALDGQGRDAVAHEVLDGCDGHPERTGQYHYHRIPSCLAKGESKAAHSRLVGYALDGYPIYGYRGDGGKQLTDAALDVCHGHTGTVVLAGKRVRTYHYHATLEYPYTLGCFHGTPVR